MNVTIAARASKLSRTQVQEVYQELLQYHSTVVFIPTWVTTTGDKKLDISLRCLDKTDFFTKEIDILVLQGDVDVGIHSAKDLPEPLPQGLARVALTRGIDPSDVLVLKAEMTLDTLPPNPIIATSSVRREINVGQLLPHARFVDIRGTIEQRLGKLDSGDIDGVVVAKAALIRLQLDVNYVLLPGETTALQGQLAVIARKDDTKMRELFSCLDVQCCM